MGSASGSKLLKPSRPMKRETPLPPSNPQIDASPNPKPGSVLATAAMPEADVGTSAASVDGADEDEALRGAGALSREEVLRRRSRRLRQLLGCYRQQYWALVEGVRVKHRDYYWEYGKSPHVEEDGGGAEENGSAAPAAAAEEEGSGESRKPGGLGFGCGQGENGVRRRGERRRCALAGCKSYAIPLTTYCHPHILMDSKQTLYKACNYVIKSAQTGQVICGKPVLRATVPSLCPVHFQKAQKHVSLALKKAGLNASSSNRPPPKIHVIIAEYVHQIQAKRRKASSATVEDVAGKDEKVG